MKLKFVEMSGFRGYCEPVRIDFGQDATIIDGRNGVGKSTIFDAVEFALTGSIAKYQDAKANQETVDDYIWWLGESEGPDERYVRVGFTLEGGETVVTRSSLQPETADNIELVASGLINEDAAPSAAMHQVCSSTIIRDEHIAALSLDLKETERYSILSSAIGGRRGLGRLLRCVLAFQGGERGLACVCRQGTELQGHAAKDQARKLDPEPARRCCSSCSGRHGKVRRRVRHDPVLENARAGEPSQ